jgi:Spy/CpxP family protein refolding chaperone
MQTNRLAHLFRVAAVALSIGVAGVSAEAQGHGPHGGPGGFGPFGGHIEHVLDIVQATEAQRSQIKSILDLAKQDLASTRTAGQTLHKQALALYTAATIDPVAIENLRVQTSANHEVASKRMSKAMIDVANVLTPEQRAKLAARLAKLQAARAQ